MAADKKAAQEAVEALVKDQLSAERAAAGTSRMEGAAADEVAAKKVKAAVLGKQVAERAAAMAAAAEKATAEDKVPVAATARNMPHHLVAWNAFLKEFHGEPGMTYRQKQAAAAEKWKAMHPKAKAKAMGKARTRAFPLGRGCSKCRWTSCSACSV